MSAYLVPGVYTEYAPSESMSISRGGNMSVAALIGPFQSITNASEDTCVFVESWLQFCEKFISTDHEISVTVTSTKPTTPPTDGSGSGSNIKMTSWTHSHLLGEWTTARHILSVKSFFENGGAKAYVIPCDAAATLRSKKNQKDSLTKSPPNDLVPIIEQYPDINLLVWCGEAQYRSKIYNALLPLVNSNDNARFLLTDTINDAEAALVTEQANVGVWTPYIIKKITAVLPRESRIVVSGYQDEENADESPASDIFLADLKVRNNALYLKILADLKASFSAFQEKPVELSPVAAVAGQFAHKEQKNGIWHSPAGMDVTLQGITGITRNFTESECAGLNEKGINALRYFSRPTPGVRVFGARTQLDSPDWRYIGVRRLYQMINRDLRNTLNKKVFSPNKASTWNAVRSAVNSYLTALWNDGALAGEKASEAFQVNVGHNITMSNEDILNGIMIVEVKFAPVRPAEFVVLRFSQIMDAA
ncbi:TPA: phage tail sheath family protein [Enterobacter bugandensis]|nr:phage tail sheath family protein [Enterobacter bugandensis]